MGFSYIQTKLIVDVLRARYNYLITHTGYRNTVDSEMLFNIIIKLEDYMRTIKDGNRE